MGPPRISVIIPAYRARTTLPLTLSALDRQVAGDGEAVIVQTGSAEELPVENEYRWVRVINVERRLFPGQARNLGASRARGELLAFLDADAIPKPGWLNALVHALAPGVELVGGAVVNGTPYSRWGTAEYVMEFLEWVPGRQTPLQHAAGCNLLVRRSTFERAGGFPEDMEAGEDTVFTVPFGVRGTLAFAREAQVTHLNRTSPRAMLLNQRRLGAAWVEVCARVPVPGARLTPPQLVPASVVGRAWALVKHSRRYRTTSGLLLRSSPQVLAGLLAWGVGVWRSALSRRASSSAAPASSGSPRG